MTLVDTKPPQGQAESRHRRSPPSSSTASPARPGSASAQRLDQQSDVDGEKHRAGKAQGCRRQARADGGGGPRHSLPAGCGREGDRRADRRHGQCRRRRCSMLRPRIASRPDWVYGFPELAPDQADKIRTAQKVSNPGCYPTGAVALIRPLVDAGLMPADYPVTINAVSGYSGGGKSMIAELRRRHRAVLRALRPRLRAQASAGDAALRKADAAADLRAVGRRLPAGHAGVGAAASRHAAGQAERRRSARGARRSATPAANMSRSCRSRTRRRRAAGSSRRRSTRPTCSSSTCSRSDKHRQAVLVARLDNLGKGASGAAVQNMRLMLGLE